ncbi:hypothetical protein [Zobellella iuensis]|uniref:Uncharacterized protein n=1 Tax=Zobellella iuensis TaxID=2803811 RepID=A0ABS1QQ00_9GAMM|nr:hypothetical protein [Zobellella iuensis]MBL1376948.1 hypothetical protein [Zobellella iuensis]
MKSISTIREMLSSDDINVVRKCQEFVDERASLERIRGESAERRANIILSTLGASSAFLVFMASNLLGDPEKVGWIAIILYAAAALWVSRSVWYCIKSIRTQSRYRLTEESVFEVQDKNEIDAIKDFLSGKIWELQCSVQPNTERLFYVQRAQRALIVFVGILLLLGVVVIVRNYLSIQPGPCVLFFVSALGVIFWFFGDYFIEKSGIWNHGK